MVSLLQINKLSSTGVIILKVLRIIPILLEDWSFVKVKGAM